MQYFDNLFFSTRFPSGAPRLEMLTALNNMTNQTNSSAFYCHFDDSFKYILLPVSYTLVFVIGLALNATALYVIVFRTKRWKPSTIYMLNLTVCDTLYIFTLPFLIFYYADRNDWPFSEPFCKLIRFLFYANLYGTVLETHEATCVFFCTQPQWTVNQRIKMQLKCRLSDFKSVGLTKRNTFQRLKINWINA